MFESEDFYDLADELGILIWQDMMFSVAMYPTTSDFLNSVTQELRYQVFPFYSFPYIGVNY